MRHSPSHLSVEPLERRVLLSGMSVAERTLTDYAAPPAAPDIPSLAQDLSADGSLSRQDLLDILNSTGAVVDADEWTSLQQIGAHAEDVFHVTEAYATLYRDIFNNPANEHYQGQPLGNLTVGSTASHLQKLEDKWFFGDDLPDSLGINYAYATEPLFGSNGPELGDVIQENIGDCYFEATIGAIAQNSKEAIENLFLDNDDGTYTIGFFYRGREDSLDFSAREYVTVNREIPASIVGSESVWAKLLRKAYAQNAEQTHSRPSRENSYEAISNGGMPGTVYRQIIGRPSDNYVTVDMNKDVIIAAVQSGKAVTYTSGDDRTALAQGVISNHAYTFLAGGYDAASDSFSLRNPWGFADIQLTWQDMLRDRYDGVEIMDATPEHVAAAALDTVFSDPRRMADVLDGNL